MIAYQPSATATAPTVASASINARDLPLGGRRVLEPVSGQDADDGRRRVQLARPRPP